MHLNGINSFYTLRCFDTSYTSKTPHNENELHQIKINHTHENMGYVTQKRTVAQQIGRLLPMLLLLLLLRGTVPKSGQCLRNVMRFIVALSADITK